MFLWSFQFDIERFSSVMTKIFWIIHNVQVMFESGPVLIFQTAIQTCTYSSNWLSLNSN